MKQNRSGNLRRLITSATDGSHSDCGSLLQLIADNRLQLQGKQLHARLVVSSITPGNFLASKLINLYSKTRNVSFARHVFDQTPEKNSFTYNAMLICYTSNDRHVDALSFFSSFLDSSVPVSNYSITSVLKSLSSPSIADVRMGSEVHAFALRRGFDADLAVGNSLINYYSKRGDAGLARKVFDNIRVRDVMTWNSMIGGYSQCGFFEESKALYRKMVDEGFRPNNVTAVSVLQACIQSKDLVFGIEVHRFAVESGIKLDMEVCNALIGLYAKCGSFDYARKLFEDMRDRDDVTFCTLISGYMNYGRVGDGLQVFMGMKGDRGLNTWNAVISGLVQNNQYDKALGLFMEIQRSGIIRCNSVTLASILPALSYYSNLKGGKEVHGYAIRNCCDCNVYVATAIVDVYGKSGFLSWARRVLDQAKCRNLIVWTALISAYTAQGDGDSAIKLFDEMLTFGIRPDQITFTSVLAACGHCGMVDKAKAIFNSMLKDHGIQPLVEHYACLVDVLSRAGRTIEAKEFISKMPVEPNAKVWGALLNGAAVSGDVELGKYVSERLFQIEPENTGNYVVMANLYSQAGKWKEADEVREIIDKIGLKKTRGRSWIDASKGTESCIASDGSC